MPDFVGLSVDAACIALAAILRDAGFETANLDARLLLAGALGCDTTALARSPERVLTADEAARLAGFGQARLRHKPVSRIFGRREFYGRDFIINERVLDPRPDSETLIDAALGHLPHDFTGRLLDLGTGSGCLILTLLAERPTASGVAADVSAPALDVARHNGERLGLTQRVHFIESDWLKNISGRFDMIISNPPYLTPGEMEFLDRNVADYDPPLALYGGSDGLDPYRLLTRQAADYLTDTGWLVFEVGAHQARAVSGFLREAGFQNIATRQDLAGRDRVVLGQWPGHG